MDLDDDGQVDFNEFLSYAIGRRKQPVELILYDISNGVSARFSLILLGRQFEAIYHSGTLVFGTEFWYGLVMLDPLRVWAFLCKYDLSGWVG